jgi:hypothetical protein
LPGGFAVDEKKARALKNFLKNFLAILAASCYQGTLGDKI